MRRKLNLASDLDVIPAREAVRVVVNALPGGVWGAPAYFNRSIYYSGVNDGVKSFFKAAPEFPPPPYT